MINPNPSPATKFATTTSIFYSERVKRYLQKDEKFVFDSHFEDLVKTLCDDETDFNSNSSDSGKNEVEKEKINENSNEIKISGCLKEFKIEESIDFSKCLFESLKEGFKLRKRFESFSYYEAQINSINLLRFSINDNIILRKKSSLIDVKNKCAEDFDCESH